VLVGVQELRQLQLGMLCRLMVLQGVTMMRMMLGPLERMSWKQNWSAQWQAQAGMTPLRRMTLMCKRMVKPSRCTCRFWLHPAHLQRVAVDSLEGRQAESTWSECMFDCRALLQASVVDTCCFFSPRKSIYVWVFAAQFTVQSSQQPWPGA